MVPLTGLEPVTPSLRNQGIGESFSFLIIALFIGCRLSTYNSQAPPKVARCAFTHTAYQKCSSSIGLQSATSRHPINGSALRPNPGHSGLYVECPTAAAHGIRGDQRGSVSNDAA